MRQFFYSIADMQYSLLEIIYQTIKIDVYMVRGGGGGDGKKMN